MKLKKRKPGGDYLPTATKEKKFSKRKFEAEYDAPEGVSFEFQNNVLKVIGPKGETSKSFNYPFIKMDVTANKIIAIAQRITKREKTMLGSFKSHIKNMIRSTSEGIIYKLKVCSTHFPMTVKIQNDKIVVNNFVGEKFPRTLDVSHPSVKVKLDGEIIEVSGVDKEDVGTMASKIELLTKRSGFDNRIFQDGIYIIEKDGKLEK
jgi:large subunit ribosomal protein L6